MYARRTAACTRPSSSFWREKTPPTAVIDGAWLNDLPLCRPCTGWPPRANGSPAWWTVIVTVGVEPLSPTCAAIPTSDNLPMRRAFERNGFRALRHHLGAGWHSRASPIRKKDESESRMLPKLIVDCGHQCVRQERTGRWSWPCAIGGEIVSADSRQVLPRAWIWAAARSRPEEMRGVPHHLIDVVRGGRLFSPWRISSGMAYEAIDGIVARGKAALFGGRHGPVRRIRWRTAIELSDRMPDLGLPRGAGKADHARSSTPC